MSGTESGMTGPQADYASVLEGLATFYFGHLLYQDGTTYPAEIETGLLRAGILHVERFSNRLPR